MKNKLLFRKLATQLFYSLCLLLICSNMSWGQQVIGSFPYMNGGFEGQTAGALGTTVSSTLWSKQNTATVTSTLVTSTGARSGANYATGSVTNSTAVNRVLVSPISPSTTSTDWPAANTPYTIQYYVKNCTATANNAVSGGITTTTGPYASSGTLSNNTTWTKVTIAHTPTTVVTQNISMVNLRLPILNPGTHSLDVDDIVVYAGGVDTTAPLAATAATTPVNGLDVAWTASSNIDGGGYLVVRFASNPNLDQDPNTNGIYAVGNTITNGTNGVANPGTVVYVGTGTSFTDAVAGSVSGSDYYKIYTVDKAFNYATELLATAVVSSTPAITSSTETLTGFNYTGSGPSASQSFVVSGSNLGANLVVSTTSTDFELSTDNFATAGVATINLSGATVASTTISVRLKSGLVGGPKSGGTVSISSTGANVLPTIALSGSVQSVYYYNGTGLLSSNTSWGTNTNGTGANPTAVTVSFSNFVFANGSASTDASWTLGSNSKLIIGNGAAVTLTVVNTFPIIGTIDAAANGSILWQDVLASPTFGSLDNASEVHFQPAAAATYALGVGTAYGKLFIDGAGIVSVSITSTPTVKAAFTVAVGSTVSFPNSNVPTLSINAGATATINGTIRTSKATGLFASTGSIPLNASATLILGAASTIEFNRPNIAQTVTTLPSGVSYANLILSETGSTTTASKTIAGAITVNGTLTTNLLGFSSTITGGGNITMASGSTFVRTSKTLDVAPTFAGTVNVTYNGTGATQMVGTTTLGSPNVTLTFSNSAIAVGNTVSGNGVPAGTTVASIAGTALVLSQNATAGATVSLTIGTAVGQTTGVELPTAVSNALNNLTFDNATGVTLAEATTGNSIIANKSNAITLATADYLNANVQVNGASQLILNVNANQTLLKQIVFSGATTAKLKLNIANTVTAIAFANSSAQNWGTGTVEITGFKEGVIRVGTSSRSLTAAQLALMKNMDDPSKFYKLNAAGYLYYTTSIVLGDTCVVTSPTTIVTDIDVPMTSYSITATNFPTSYALADATNSPLPPGLSLNTTTGVISGTPTVAVSNLVVPIIVSNAVNDLTTNFIFTIVQRADQVLLWDQAFGSENPSTYGDSTIALTAGSFQSLNQTTSTELAVIYSSSNSAVATVSGNTLTIVGPGSAIITASQVGNTAYTAATNITRTLVVNAKPLTIASATAIGKVYNKSTTATITGTLAGGLVGSDLVTLVLSGIFADANAGNAIAVTSTSTLAGAQAAKYSLTQPAGLTANITKAAQLLANFGTSAFHILGDPDYEPIPLVTDPIATGVPSVAIENPSFDYTSSNLNVATIVNGKVHIVGLGSTTLTAVQSESQNYFASLPVTQTLTVLCAPIAAWDFSNFSITSAGGTPAQPSTCVATEVAIGVATPSLSMGNMTTSITSQRYRFQSVEWPYAISTGTVAPINIATGKYMSVVIQPSAGKKVSLSGINAAFRGSLISGDLLSQFAYSIDGTNFTPIGDPTNFSGPANTRFYSTIDLSGIAALQNVTAGTTITLRYYASGKNTGTTTATNNNKQWGFFSDFVPTNTRGLIIGGSVTTIAPTALAQTLCASKTVADLTATGTNLKWYENALGDDALLGSTVLSTKNYYVSQTLDGQESDRTEVAVIIQAAPNAGTNGTLTVCAGTSPSEADLFAVIGAHDAGFWSNSGLVYTFTVNATSPCIAAATATVTVIEQAIPNAGTNGTLTVCAGTTPSSSDLFAKLGGSPMSGGSWTNEGLVYTYTVNAITPCTTVATATVTLTIQAAPNAGTDSTLNVATGVIPTDVQLFAALTGADTGGSWTKNGLIYTYTVAAIAPCTVSDTATVTVLEVIPASFTVCAGTTISAIVGTSSLKFYADVKAALPLPLTTVLGAKPYFVTQLVGGVESTSRKSVPVVVNALPATPSALVLTNDNAVLPAISTTAVTALGLYAGTETPFKLTATDVGAVSYKWTLPSGVERTNATGTTTDGSRTSTDAFIYVKFTEKGVATPLVMSVQSVNLNGCTSVAKPSAALTRVLPAAPAAILVTDASLPVAEGKLPAPVKSFAIYMGSPKVLTLTATPSPTATSYIWELPAGVTQLSGGTSNVITVNFEGVTNVNTANYLDAKGILTHVLRIGVKAVNGVGSSITDNQTKPLTPPTDSKAKLLVLTATAPTAPALVLNNPLLEVALGAKPLAITVISKLIGQGAVYRLTAAISPLASSYSWELPSCVTRVTDVNGLTATTSTTSIDPFIFVKFDVTTAPAGSIYFGVKAVNGVGSSNSSALNTEIKAPGKVGSEFSLLRLLTVAPAAPALVLNNPLLEVATGAKPVAIAIISKLIGQGAVYRLNAAVSPLANSYSWELPSCVTRVTDVSGSTVDNTLTSNQPFIFIKFDVAAALAGSIYFGVKAVNGVGSSNSSIANTEIKVPGKGGSEFSLLKLVTVVPAAPGSLVLNDVNSATSSAAVAIVSKYIGSNATLKLSAGTSILANSYSWELPSCVTRVTNLDGLEVDNSSTSTDPFIYVKFNGTTPAAGLIYFGVKAVNGVGSSFTVNTGATSARTDKVLAVTAGLPSAVAKLGGSLSVCDRTQGFSYTITAPLDAKSYIITAPLGSVVSSTTAPNNTSNVLATSDLTFKVVYAGTAPFSKTDNVLLITSVNDFGVSVKAFKSAALTKQVNCSSLTGTARMAASNTTDNFNVIASPNPSPDSFTLDIQSSGKGNVTTNVQVYDMTGRLIEQRQAASNSVEIGNNYPTGIYNVIVNQGENTKTLRVIKN